ncbi:hypothetical protein Q7P37_003854 [Cladosporium fusiforme]
MSYSVYTAEYLGSLNHVRIFVETTSDGDGFVFHVIGNILRGMTYEKRPGNRFDDPATFVPRSMVRIGSIEATDLARFESACEAVPVPGAQLKLNGKPIDASKPIRRCGEWVQDVKEKVIAEKIMRVEEIKPHGEATHHPQAVRKSPRLMTFTE